MNHLAEVIAEVNRESRHDSVNCPLHYTGGAVECLDAIEAAVPDLTGIEAHLTACCIRYLWRWKAKNGLEDLKKCEAYLKRLIKKAEDG